MSPSAGPMGSKGSEMGVIGRLCLKDSHCRSMGGHNVCCWSKEESLKNFRLITPIYDILEKWNCGQWDGGCQGFGENVE